MTASTEARAVAPSGWAEVDNALVCELRFADFVEAFAFMGKVAELAEAQQHHPEWSNVYNRVAIRLTTHDAGNTVTDKDLRLATDISGLPEFVNGIQGDAAQ